MSRERNGLCNEIQGQADWEANQYRVRLVGRVIFFNDSQNKAGRCVEKVGDRHTENLFTCMTTFPG